MTYSLPFDEIAVFNIALTTPFRDVTVREGALLRRGERWAEFSPFLEYSPAEAAWWLACAMEQLDGNLPHPRRTHIPVNCIVPAVSPHQAKQIVAASGCDTAKVKVAQAGQDPAEDVRRVAAVREALGPTGRLRIDANGAWSVQQAVAMIKRLAPYELEYVEQPCATVAELAKVRTVVEVPIAADESVRRACDPLEVARAAAADLVVLKVQPLGGVRRALRIAEECGLPVVVSSAVETSVGLAAGLRLAATLPQLPYACGLATSTLLTSDVTATPFVPRAGEILVRDYTIEPKLVHQHAAAPSRQGWWRERIHTAYRQLMRSKESVE